MSFVAIIYMSVLVTSGSVYISNNLNHKIVGQYMFPKEESNGQEYSNEFQLISPNQIQYSTYFKQQQQSSSQFLKDEQFEITSAFEHIASNSSFIKYAIDSVSPLLISNNDIVSVSYYSSSPDVTQDKGDWIGVYSPSNVDITKTVPGL